MTRVDRLVLAAGHHLADHAVSEREALQLARNSRALLRARRDMQSGRRLLVGSTDGGRALTLVLEPTGEPGTWTVITGWDATAAERRAID